MDGTDPQRALTEAVRLHLDGLRTEPMTVARLRDYFGGMNRNKLLRLLRSMPGVEDCGGGYYRVPLARMPPSYHVEIGLLPAA